MIASEMPKPLVLIVDDVNENLRLLGNTLTENGYSVAIASNGKKAEQTAILRKPDLILLDIGLPDVDGFTICNNLKSNAITAEIPIIFLTARNDQDDKIKGFLAGAVDYITKPFFMPELLARVKTHIELKQAKDRIEKLSFYDEVSGIPNKRYFNKYFEVEWNNAISKKEPLSALMIDIDLFKKYNDTYGHIEGDKCLGIIAKTIDFQLEKEGSFTARFGGEEFVCVLPNTNEKEAYKTAEQIRESIFALKIPIAKKTNSEFITVSGGVNTIVPDDESDMPDFINDADKALYRAKELGRNRICSFK